MELAAGQLPLLWFSLPLVGAAAGLLGGLFGIGGGLVIIPALLLLIGQAYGHEALHLFKLASLMTSVVVAVPATLRQVHNRLVVRSLLLSILPLGCAGVLIGVALGSLFQAERTRLLAQLFGGFMIAVAASQYLPLQAAVPHVRATPCGGWWRVGAVVGFPAGVISGLLGVAGGVWAVPAQSTLLGVNLRNAIANSTAMIVMLATLAAGLQALVVSHSPALRVIDACWLALWLSPGALVGGWFGAHLMSKIPVAQLRIGFHAVMIITGLRLLI